MTLLVVGYGYLGQAIARVFRERGWLVIGVNRSGDGGCLVGDVSDLASVEAWPRVDGIVHCAASSRGGVDAYQRVFVDGCRHLVQVYPRVPMVFVSSTSVYGQVDGEEVTEASPTVPERETSRKLLEAEQVVRDGGGMVARLAGIYGPQRSVILRKFLDGTAVIEEGGERILNQIHRDDAATAIECLMKNGMPGQVVNVCDDTPMTQQACYQGLADYYHAPLPPAGPKETNRKRAWTNKRVSNGMLRAMGWRPEYPSYLDALGQLG